MRRRTAAADDGWILVAFVLLAAVAAFFLVLNMPPYQNPDETNHYLRADHLSRGYLLPHRFDENRASGGPASPEISASDQPFEPPKFHPEIPVARDAYAAAAQHFGAPPVDINFPNTAVYPPTFYLQAVAAVALGKAAGLSVVQTLYLARGATALVSGALVAVALAICLGVGANGAALLIFVLATLPMSLSLQSAVSQDGPMLAATALAASCLVRLRAAPGAGSFVLLCLCLALVIAARPPFAPMAVALLFVRVPLPTRLLGLAVVLAVSGLWVYLSNTAGAVAMRPGLDPMAQVHALLDPARALGVLLATLHSEWRTYLVSFIGQLGWLDVTLPKWFIPVAGIGLALVAACVLDLRTRLTVGVGLGAVGAVLGVLFAIYVTWTVPGRPIVDGVQGRYFLMPALLLAGLATTLPRGWPGWTVRLVGAALPVIGLGVTMRAIVVRYYLGQ